MPEEENVVKEAIKDSKDILRLSLVTIILTFKDVNGTHVMQKIIFAIKEENRSAINETRAGRARRTQPQNVQQFSRWIQTID